MKNKIDIKQDIVLSVKIFTGITVVGLLVCFYIIVMGIIDHIKHHEVSTKAPTVSIKTESAATPIKKFEEVWIAPDIATLSDSKETELIKYGQDLIANTSHYLGPKGTVKALSNGLNCQNCHLAAGTKPFGNNYGGVASTYPKIRSRSGTMTTVEDRINACFKRSLNGNPLPVDGKEMTAMVAYMEWLGKDIPEGKKPVGAGLYEIAYLERAADPDKGKKIYDSKCAACHKPNGEGILNSDEKTYLYPPLWGEHSYNVSAGLFRISKFARYVKVNMPYGVDYKNPMLSDEESWDVAAYVNSKQHPDKRFEGDWEKNLIKKPIDAPFGPYADGFDETQHKYGPYKPILEEIAALQNQN